jgi:DNA-binding LytR/AlgR family response regulator
LEEKNLQVLIVEDEQAAARRLKRLLENEGLEVLGTLHSLKSAIKWFASHQAPDLIFLDIQLSDGLSFTIFDHVSIKSALIFTTAYDEYALQAFKLNSIDYLLKPIDKEELHESIKKFKASPYHSSKETIDFEDIKKLLYADKQAYKTRFTVQVGSHIKILQLPEIICFYSENKGTYALMESGRSYLMNHSMEGLEAEIPPESFFRISRKCIVQLSHIQDIISYSSARLQIKIGVPTTFELVVSRERVKDFKLWIS